MSAHMILLRKLRVPHWVGVKSFTQQEAHGSELPPNCRSSHWAWGWRRDCVSASPTHLNIGFFLVCLIRSWSTGFFPQKKKNVPYLDLLCLSMGRSEVRVFLWCYFELEPWKNDFLMIFNTGHQGYFETWAFSCCLLDQDSYQFLPPVSWSYTP